MKGRTLKCVKFDSELTTLRTRLAEVEAESAVMREAIEKCDCYCRGKYKCTRCSVLESTAGKSLLERLQEAERLMNEIDERP